VVRLQVSDLRRSIEYYERVIGLRVQREADSAAVLGPHGDDRPLVHLQSRSGVLPARRGALGLYHFAILLPDRAALGRFASHLSASHARVGMADHFVSEAFYLWDPDGLGIEVYADRPRSSWRHHSGELMMSTEPLDVADVIAEGAGRPWDGMPAGTTMGHVHLSVGSLREAEGSTTRSRARQDRVELSGRAVSRPADIIITLARTCGRPVRLRGPMRHGSSNGSSSCRTTNGDDRETSRPQVSCRRQLCRRSVRHARVIPTRL
jgi:catechol 2,3-dioxygenase-like lactoylglutathione lyase family enzyme